MPALQDSSLGQGHFSGLMRRQGAAKGVGPGLGNFGDESWTRARTQCELKGNNTVVKKVCPA